MRKLVFFLAVLATVKGATSGSSDEGDSQPAPSLNSGEFNKKLGQLDDQLAVESNNVEHRGEHVLVPVPFPMPGLRQQSMVFAGPPGPAPRPSPNFVPPNHAPSVNHAPHSAPLTHPRVLNHAPTPPTLSQSTASILSAQLNFNQHKSTPEKHPAKRPLASTDPLANSIFREMFSGKKKVKNSASDLIAEGGEYQQSIAAPLDSDMPKIVSLEVKCEKNVMRVYIAFDQPFYGVVFSKGHYHNLACIHLPAGLGHTSANFDISTSECGTQGATEPTSGGYGSSSNSGSFFENIIVIQYDAQVQEVWDSARKLRCTWHDQYEKSVTFRPFPVDMLDVVRADFAGDNVGCWMQIQVGKGPWASEVTGLVKIGQTMTMVLAIKDDDSKFDMLVRNCLAHDGVRAPVQLVDQFGCITRPKLMSKFTKIKNFGQSASVLSYTHFQAFKFPDSMEVHFQCTIQICRFQCPEQCTEAGGYKQRRKRHTATASNDSFSYTVHLKQDVGLDKTITVVAREDLDFGGEETVTVSQEYTSGEDVVCMSTFGLSSILVVLVGCLVVASGASGWLYLRRRKV